MGIHLLAYRVRHEVRGSIMPIKNYTTDVPVDRTIQELQKILAKGRANAIMTEYDPFGFPCALSFHVLIRERDLRFRLPVDVDGVTKALKKDRQRNDKKHAQRVAWRIVKDWVDAQMALIESQQAEIAQVFLPYAITDQGWTLYQAMQDKGFLQIGSR